MEMKMMGAMHGIKIGDTDDKPKTDEEKNKSNKLAAMQIFGIGGEVIKKGVK